MKYRWKQRLALLLIGVIWMQVAGSPMCQEYLDMEQRSYAKAAYGNLRMIVHVKAYCSQEFVYKNCDIEWLDEEYISLVAHTEEAFAYAKKELLNDPAVQEIQPDYVYTLLDTPEEQNNSRQLTNDAKLEKQWGLQNDGSHIYVDEVGEKINAVEGVDIDVKDAWEHFQSKDDVVVAVIDTGVDYNHEDLRENIWTNVKEIPGNGKDDDGNGYIDDIHGWDFYNKDKSVCTYNENGKSDPADNDNHGTHCAGTIAAVANNEKGIAGVASNVNVKIMVCKALGGTNGATQTSYLIKAIKYAINNGADLINASWGGWMDGKEDAALKDIISRSGLLVISAAGNAGSNNDEKACYPANYTKELTNVVSVGSVDCNGAMSRFSNYGSSVDILAPGSDIYSTIVGGYGNMSGTSMAAPHVTGVAAMLCAGKKNTYPKNLKELLLYSYKELELVDDRRVSRAGIISAGMAVSKRNLVLQDVEKPNITDLCAAYDGTLRITTTDSGGSGVCAVLYAKGKKGKSYFQKGAKGTVIKGKKIKLKKSGIYTFYVKDQAGNSTIARTDVTVDVLGPKITASRKKKKITLTVKDPDAGIAFVKYAKGKKKKSYFANGYGKNLKLNKYGKAVLEFHTGHVTIYAKDKAGNETYKIFNLG